MVQKSLTSKAYILGVTKSNLKPDIFKVIYTVLNKSLNTHSPGKFWYPAYPYEDIDQGRASYPIGIIDITITEERFTITKKWAKGIIDIEVYSTSAETRDNFSQQVFNIVDANSGLLMTLGIKKMNKEGADHDHVMRGGELKIYSAKSTYNFQYSFTRGEFS